jgi:hypothetical protein
MPVCLEDNVMAKFGGTLSSQIGDWIAKCPADAAPTKTS